ncbi:MAG: cysteine desulfurase family protein [Bacillota bacterium]|nr:cysteine desulfurase family protein [Bacillota bacterium]
MNNEIYFDNAATTAVSEKAAKKIMELLTVKYGNPSSLHTKGIEAEAEVDYARKITAHTLSASHNEIYFTSGGTEANNLAVIGAAMARKKIGKKIVSTSIEHSSVMKSLKYLEDEGFEVTYLKPDANGIITPKEFADAVDDQTVLVTAMLVNNEIGSVLDIENIRNAVFRKNPKTVFHTDAVAAFGKIPINVKTLGVDLLTISAHKIHGPKGVGALFVKNGVRLIPRSFGGSQEKGLRIGTEATPLIAGFGAAVSELEIKDNLNKISELQSYLRKELLKLDDVDINSPPDAMPYILNFSANGIKSETLLHYLASENIFVSSGSACAKGKQSHVLVSLGLNKRRADSALRISFSHNNTKEEIDVFLSKLQNGLNSLVRK